MNLPSPDDLIETFGFLPDWEARYTYLIDLGRALPNMDNALKTDSVLVPGCTSRVWVVAEHRNHDLYHFHIDSDAAIVRGLCAVVMVFMQDKTADDIKAVDVKSVFEKLHLAGNLSPNRRNGFFAMIERIRELVG